MNPDEMTIYRRHVPTCRFTSQKDLGCKCPLWAYGIRYGWKVRFSLKTRDWKTALGVLDQEPPKEILRNVDELMVAKAITIHEHTEDDGPCRYLIAGGQSIKIGVTKDVDSRLAGLQTGNSTHLSVRRVFRGGKKLEQALHDLLQSWHRRGEWFIFDGTLQALVRTAFLDVREHVHHSTENFPQAKSLEANA
jgi:hypothetical protein